MKNITGIILAGGTGSRLRPITTTVNKHFLPVYNKPMIYYPLSILLLLGLKKIIIISDKLSIKSYKKLLNDGSFLGVNISYLVQKKPNGIPESFIIAKKKINKGKTILILGDNFFYGKNLINIISEEIKSIKGCSFFGFKVSKPENYAVISRKRKNIMIEEKPKNPKSEMAIPGLYIFDSKVIDYAKSLKKSSRGEFEIVDLIKKYVRNKNYSFSEIPRGVSWLDMGTFDDLVLCSSLIKTLEDRQNLMIGSPEEIAFRMGNISKIKLQKQAKKHKNFYGKYLYDISVEKKKN